MDGIVWDLDGIDLLKHITSVNSNVDNIELDGIDTDILPDMPILELKYTKCNSEFENIPEERLYKSMDMTDIGVILE